MIPQTIYDAEHIKTDRYYGIHLAVPLVEKVEQEYGLELYECYFDDPVRPGNWLSVEYDTVMLGSSFPPTMMLKNLHIQFWNDDLINALKELDRLSARGRLVRNQKEALEFIGLFDRDSAMELLQDCIYAHAIDVIPEIIEHIHTISPKDNPLADFCLDPQSDQSQ